MVEDSDNSSSFLRQVLVASLCVGIAAGGLALWYQIRDWSLGNWSDVSFGSTIPLLIGISIGWVCRRLSAGGFGVAGFTVLLVFATGVIGWTLQYAAAVDRTLQTFTATAYEETLDYGQRVLAAADDQQLHRTITNSEVAVIGRITCSIKDLRPDEFWQARNFIHLHWIAARQITIYGQGGAERMIWDATKILNQGPFLDDLVLGLRDQPITETELRLLKKREQPKLAELVDDKISRADFRNELTSMVNARIEWLSLAGRGFGLVVGFFTLAGALISFNLARKSAVAEII